MFRWLHLKMLMYYYVIIKKMVDNIQNKAAQIHIMLNKFALYLIKIKLNRDVLMVIHKYGSFNQQKIYKFNSGELMIPFYLNTEIVIYYNI